jgi:hypothetical protein
VRQAVVDQLCCFPERYKDYVSADYHEYCSSMSKLGTWGDHVSLQAAAGACAPGVSRCMSCSVTPGLAHSIYVATTAVVPQSPSPLLTLPPARPPPIPHCHRDTDAYHVVSCLEVAGSSASFNPSLSKLRA